MEGPGHVLREIMQLNARKQYADAVRMGEEILVEYPDEKKLRFHVARAYRLSGETDKALEHLHYVVNTIDENDVYALHALAEIAIENNQSERAVYYLQRELQQAPDSKIAMSVLFDVYMAQKNFKGAHELGEKLLALPDSKEDPVIFVGMVRLCLAERNMEGAEHYMEKLWNLPGQEKHSHTFGLRVRVFLAQGDREGAKKVVDELMQEDPENDVGMVLKGRIAVSEGDMATAKEMARALGQKPFHPTNMLFMRSYAF